MKILILEDEPLVAEHLIAQVMEMIPQTVLEGPVVSLRDARVWFGSHDLPDLILADIQLADGISIDLFLELKLTCPVIFTTAFDQYAMRAFKVNGIDYLLKPVQPDELQTALDKFNTLQRQAAGPLHFQELASFLKDKTQQYKENFVIHQGATSALVEAQDVAGFVKQDLIFLVQSNGRKSVTGYRSLDEVEAIVDPAKYFRANRQVLIHRRMIQAYKTDQQGKLTLSAQLDMGEPVVISKEKAGAFRKWFEGEAID
jgi:DNA-binding LytR/AlgR family response regulator